MTTNIFGANNQGLQMQGSVYGSHFEAHHHHHHHHKDSLDARCLQALAFSGMTRREDIHADTPETCQWFTSQDSYLRWIQDGGVLILEGRAGCGKTTVMEQVSHYSGVGNEKSITLVLFFRRSGEQLQQTSTGFLRCILHQVFTKRSDLLCNFVAETSAAERCKQQGEPGVSWMSSDDELQRQWLKQMASFYDGRVVRLYIHGMDEVEKSSRLFTLKTLRQAHKNNPKSLSILTATRPTPKVTIPGSTIIRMNNGHHADIERYVERRFAEYEMPVLFAKIDLREVQKAIVRRASGVFKWVAMVIDRIIQRVEDMEGEVDTNGALRRLEGLPDGLDAMYDHILSSLELEDVETALCLFRWLMHFPERLTLDQLRQGPALHPQEDFPDLQELTKSARWYTSDEQFLQMAKRLSGGLIVAEPFSSTERWRFRASYPPEWSSMPDLRVRFDHQSVYEYMNREGLACLERRLNPHNLIGNTTASTRANDALSRCCMSYLKLRESRSYADRVAVGDIQGSKTGQRLHGDLFGRPKGCATLPLLTKVLKHVLNLAFEAENGGLSQSWLLDATPWPSEMLCKILCLLLCVYGLRGPASYTHKFGYDAYKTSWTHLAASYGLRTVLETICDRQSLSSPTGDAAESLTDLSNARHCFRYMPAIWAARNGRANAIQFLIMKQVDLEECDDEGMPPLWLAAKEGHLRATELLLDADCSILPDQLDVDSAVHHAAREGQWQVVWLLLQYGAPVDDEGEGSSIIHIAVETAHELELDAFDLVRTLAETHHAAVDNPEIAGRTVLHIACERHVPGLVDWLLSTQKVDVNRHCSEPVTDGDAEVTPLHLACRNGLEDVVRPLLHAQDIDANATDALGETPLHKAAKSWSASSIGLLLQSGKAAVNALNKKLQTPLHLVFQGASHDYDPDTASGVVRCLLECNEIDVNGRDRDGNTPLDLALIHPYPVAGAIRMILNYNNINFRDSKAFASGYCSSNALARIARLRSAHRLSLLQEFGLIDPQDDTFKKLLRACERAFRDRMTSAEFEEILEICFTGEQ